jgi:transcription-repair coupling factor (superfamily II helicase)
VEGDFVVHLQHGIALYRGLTKLDTAQGIREVISLEFDDRVTLHVPLQESHLISRYVGLSKARPQLGRIGSGRWEKARQAAERSTIDLAAELLRIQAAREAQPGHAFRRTPRGRRNSRPPSRSPRPATSCGPSRRPRPTWNSRGRWTA